ncbi:MAG: VWA domain-containing protein, partial [Planctomycetota bacterium]
MGSLNKSGWRCVCALVGGGFLFSSLSAAQPVPGTPLEPVPGVMRFVAPQGATYSALILPAPALPKLATVPHDHVLIVDTSASQNGIYRNRALALANAVCRELPAGDRVQLIAADVACSSLTEEFVETSSKALASGFERLEDRVPLGSTNIELALRTALQSFSGDRARSILYIGDGFSTAKLIESSAMLKLLTALRTAAVPVNSFAVGPSTDLILLGTLAQHTGGVVVIDEPQLVADRQGGTGDLVAVAKDLARASSAPVFYPTTLTTQPQIPHVYPTLLPPVRFDRETVLLTKDLTSDQIQVKLTGTFQGQPKTCSWLLKSEIVTGSLSFLAPTWALAENSQGLAVPLAGRQLIVNLSGQSGAVR